MTLQELMTFARENLWNKFIITNNINTDHIYGTALKLSHEPVVYKSLKSISDKLVPYFDDPEIEVWVGSEFIDKKINK